MNEFLLGIRFDVDRRCLNQKRVRYKPINSEMVIITGGEDGNFYNSEVSETLKKKAIPWLKKNVIKDKKKRKALFIPNGPCIKSGYYLEIYDGIYKHTSKITE